MQTLCPSLDYIVCVDFLSGFLFYLLLSLKQRLCLHVCVHVWVCGKCVKAMAMAGNCSFLTEKKPVCAAVPGVKTF